MNKNIAIGVCAYLFLAGVMPLSSAQDRVTKPASFGPARSMTEILNPDGTIKLGAGVSGSFDPRGFRMIAEPGKPPRFVADATSAAPPSHAVSSASPSSGYWDDRCTVVGASDSVSALAVQGGIVYAGGLFQCIGDVPASCIAKWDGTAWSALGSGLNQTVLTLAISGPDLYAGGLFFTAGGVTVNRVAKWNGTTWTALGSGMNFVVYALAASGPDLYAGGAFTTAGGVSANQVAKWDGTAWSALGSGMNSNVYALAVSGTDLYAGGAFTTAGGVTVNRVAKWNGTTWSALGSGMNDSVFTLAVSGTESLCGGRFHDGRWRFGES